MSYYDAANDTAYDSGEEYRRFEADQERKRERDARDERFMAASDTEPQHVGWRVGMQCPVCELGEVTVLLDMEGHYDSHHTTGCACATSLFLRTDFYRASIKKEARTRYRMLEELVERHGQKEAEAMSRSIRRRYEVPTGEEVA